MHNGAIMPSEVRHLVDHGRPYPLVRLTGVLDAGTASTVRSLLFGVLAAQPEAVVVDVSDLRLARSDAASVLHQVLQDTRDWPGTNLVLAGSPDAAGWHASGWPVWPDSDSAFADLGTPDTEHRLSLELQPIVGAARRSREMITEVCARWELPDLTGPACTVVTEMVNNVVAHVRTPMVVLLARHGDTMSVAVRDDSPVIPEFTGPVGPTSYGGRGLLLIDSEATRWGSLPLDRGKVVWALVEGEEPTYRPGRRHPDEAGMTGPTRG